MYEKVNPSHPDKVADRIAGALVDYAYTLRENPTIAVEAMIGHGECHIMIESSVRIPKGFIDNTVGRIAGFGRRNIEVFTKQVSQDKHLSENQAQKIRCGDNGIFKGTEVTEEQIRLTRIAKKIYETFPTDGKYILDGDQLTICQSNADDDLLRAIALTEGFSDPIINPLGHWTGGPDVDTGCVNRKLGSDMGDSVTGGGLFGKDLSKADVSINIYAWKIAQDFGRTVEMSCSIGDEFIKGLATDIPYRLIVTEARDYILSLGGFEKFAEWGLIR